MPLLGEDGIVATVIEAEVSYQRSRDDNARVVERPP